MGAWKVVRGKLIGFFLIKTRADHAMCSGLTTVDINKILKNVYLNQASRSMRQLKRKMLLSLTELL